MPRPGRAAAVSACLGLLILAILRGIAPSGIPSIQRVGAGAGRGRVAGGRSTRPRRMRRVSRPASARHPAARRLARRVRPHVLHPGEPAPADRTAGHAEPRRSSARPRGGAAVLSQPRARAAPRSGEMARSRRVADPVHAAGSDDAGHARHAGRVARASRGRRRRQAARRARDRHAAGTGLHRPSGQGRQRALGRRQHPAPVARRLHRRGQGRCSGSARGRPRHVLPRRSQQGGRDLAARARRREVQRLLAGRLAARREPRRRRLQRRRQDRSRRRGVRMAQDRLGRHPREQDGERVSTRRSRPARSIRARAASTSSRPT